MVSGTIQLPSELYSISPPFKIRRQISLKLPLELRGSFTLLFFIYLFYSRQPRSLYPLPTPPIQRAPYKTEHCGIVLSYAFLKLNSKKGVLFFLLLFSTIEEQKKKKDRCGVCICIMICIMLLFCVLLYYPSII